MRPQILITDLLKRSDRMVIFRDWNFGFQLTRVQSVQRVRYYFSPSNIRSFNQNNQSANISGLIAPNQCHIITESHNVKQNDVTVSSRSTT